MTKSGNKPKVMIVFKNILTKNIFRILIGAVLGAFLGELYWEFIGCNSGSCPLTSTQLKSILFFTMMGAWFSYKK